MFALDPRIEASSAALIDLGLCHLRLQHDARFPWLVLIPRYDGAREIEDLSIIDQSLLMGEIIRAGAVVRALGAAASRPVEKLNVGALGNIVPQLHVHIVGRRTDDEAWPGPVWGVGEPLPYSDADLQRAADLSRRVLTV